MQLLHQQAIKILITNLSKQMIFKIIGELALVGAIASVFIVAAQEWAQERAAEESSGREYMRTLDDQTSKMRNKMSLANWAYDSNLTKHNEDILVSAPLIKAYNDIDKKTVVYHLTDILYSFIITKQTIHVDKIMFY